MGKLNYSVFFIFIFSIFSFQFGFAQLSKTHYIPPLTSAEFGNANPEDQWLYLSTPNGNDVPYTIKPVGQGVSSYITGLVSNTNSAEIYLGNGNGQLFVPSSTTSTVISNKGYIIEAEDVIYASVRMEAGGAQAGALVSKGLSSLGTTFRVGSYTNEAATTNYLNFVSVMATEDNTQVTFSDLPAGINIKNYSGTTPVIVTLNKSQSYIVATNSSESAVNKDGLIGSLVSSNKPIVVNCGSANGSFHNGGGRDYGIDQIVDFSKVGDKYIFVKGDGDNEWENVLIVAHQDNTAISINGVPTGININGGEYHLIEGDKYNINGNMYVETSNPVFAYQGIGSGGSEANQGMFFVPPLSCNNRGNVDNIAQIDNIGIEPYIGGVTIVTNFGANVTINQLPLSNFSTIGPFSVDGNPNYETYKVNGLFGNISVECDRELYCAYFNINGSASSGSFYSGFPSPPEINFDAEFVTLGNCIPNITLSAANTDNFDTYEWWFDDGTGFITTGISTPEITPTIPGKYQLRGIILCSLLELKSVEIPVSICPDDIDNDGIIDNLDIDNDNDGILNCLESRGNVTLNLLNKDQPELIFQDGTNDSSIANGVFTQNNSSGTSLNTLTGTTTGIFTSTVQPASNAESEYKISFTESVNVKFMADLASTHIAVDGEFFIAKISPVNKNITLLDPDDRLLVDSNFDGIFETGITKISGSEIHFKFNPSPLGTTPYEFFANKVDSFSFIHKLNNVSDSSSFNGIISLTCFNSDIDGDGIEDALDSDSDNDGIPDYIEVNGINNILSGIDADTNGLDDIFNSSTPPNDSDNDGVFDFYDLDSDNDGIFDIEESGSLLADTNFDGVIDSPIVGLNGLQDSAETTPDSNVIAYVIDDLDADLVFSYIDKDTDGDLCSDVIEANFIDNNNDDRIDGTGVDSNGVVIGSNGYLTPPHANYRIVAPITIIEQPVSQSFCELDSSTFSIETNLVDSYKWQISIDNGNSWNDITDDLNYSNSTTNTLTISNTPLSFNNYKFRVQLDKNGNTCGLISDEVLLTVNAKPIANIAPPMIFCDDDNNGTMPFNLTSQDIYISTVAGMTITYHTSQNDANNNTDAISGSFETGNTTIYARVQNDLTTCYATSKFDLSVYDSAFPLESANIIDLSFCDNTSFGTDTDGYIIFDLTEREIEILNGQSSSEFTLTYFKDSDYNIASQIPLSEVKAFKNTNPGGQQIYVRMTNNLSPTCFTDTDFNIEVFRFPEVNLPAEYSQCDDMTNDGFALFNLTSNNLKEEIAPNFISESLIFTYYTSQTEAELGGVPTISSPSIFQNIKEREQEIWIRVENPNGCFRIVPLTLKVTPSSIALESYIPSPLVECDNGIDARDGIANFDLTNLHNYISNTIFTSINVTVHFYEKQIDAELENNVIQDITNHNNSNSQDIWVRVKSDLGNNCLGLKEFQNLLNVEALPTANPVTITRQCDDDNDGIFPFDTSTIEATVLGSQNLTDVSISYFDSLGNPLQDMNGNIITSPLPNPFSTSSQIITIRVTNNTTLACFDETTLEFIVDASPVANTVIIPPACDDESNDGIYDFDTSTIEAAILGIQPGMEVHYFDETGELPSPLPNPFSTSTQTITVEVLNSLNSTCIATTTLDFVVNPLPNFEIETPQILCITNPASTITLSVDQEDVNEILAYEWADANGSVFSEDSTAIINQSGVYTVTLTKIDGTNCSRTKEIIINNSEIAQIDLDDIIIEDDSDNNTITINNDSNNLGTGNYEFSLDNEFFGYQDEPFFDFVLPGIHTIFIQDKNNCGTSQIDVSVIGYPKFFTPNNDGYNDTWQILGISENFYSNSIIYIFDRFGKLITQIDPKGIGWNGMFNGNYLPSTDYWFSVELIDHNGVIKIKKGHFSLLRK